MTIDESVVTERSTWTGISSFSNFKYEENGIRVWKAFGVGDGTIFQYDNLFKDNKPQCEVKYTCSDYTEPVVSTGSIQRSDSLVSQFCCTEEGCTKLFKTDDELSRHLSLGRHN
ncbi:hypothetical protein SNE40_009692 [Patella caerulea]|uniref:C2H2-type domain-containing protein n=1 Tax=Patella caerulea TaxID=87958 RepID=A0AAN8JTW8_PATCE